MSHDLLTQLSEYGTYCDERQGTVTADDITDAVIPLPMPTQPTRPRHGWLIAAAAAAVVLLVAGGLALLGLFGGDRVAPVNEPAATTIPTQTTIPATTVPASEPVATTTVPQTTLPVAPVVPPGEGPRLAFVQADEAPDVDLSDGVWFNGALYALGQDRDSSGRTLHRSTDGLSWEVVSGLPASVGYAWHSKLRTDGDRLVNVVMPEQGTSIEVLTSLDGDDWTSTTIEVPIPVGSNMAGEFAFDDEFWPLSGGVSVGPKGIVLAATFTLTFEGEDFANSLVNPNEDIHVEVVELDLDRGVMVVKYLDETNDMAQIGELEEVDLNSAGFSGAFSNLLDAMATDPDWNPQIEPFIAELTDVYTTGFASTSVGYAWHSPDGINWQRVDTAGPLDGGAFSAILATPDGFVATASTTAKSHGPSLFDNGEASELSPFDSRIVWESTDGTTWTPASSTSQYGSDASELAEWQGDIVERVGYVQRRVDDTNVWTLAEPPRAVFPDVSTQGMILEVTRLGLIGTPTYGWEGSDKIEVLFSPDGASWNRWEPPEFGQGNSQTEVWLVGAGSDFIVVQVLEWNEASEPSRSLWVGRLP